MDNIRVSPHEDFGGPNPKIRSVAMKKLFALALLATATAGLSGCFSVIDWEHNKNHMRAWNHGFSRAHSTIDRFFFDYDWDDPTRSYDYSTPNS